jgi:hypothetical protein
VGTLAEQNANTVAITGGTINGTTVGATTASTGAFTTLSASSTVSGTGFSTYLASPPAIGGTAPSAGTFTTLIGGGGSANYGQLTGGATGKAVEFVTLGSDSNVSLVLDTKGTGAIDLAAGSSGVNISNGGTVTAITRTASGGPSYTTVPSVTVSAPTTSGGVQATASVTMFVASATVSGGGTGYTVGDVLSVTGGTLASGTPATLTVATLSGSAVATVTITNAASYTALPSNPVSVTGGTGSGATFTIGWGVNTIVVGTAGSGYVEQPTVTFSSGAAAAYATVGAIPTVRTLGSAISFATPSSEVFRIIDANPSAANYLSLESGGGGVIFRTAGVGANLPIGYVTKGTGQHSFTTAGSATNVQMQVTHTASAVNYVQITGATTASKVVAISAQGSDADVTLSLAPKGAGTIRFGTYTAGVLTPTGYITITDSGGTSRRLLVG